jgi:hypothetical protein
VVALADTFATGAVDAAGGVVACGGVPAADATEVAAGAGALADTDGDGDAAGVAGEQADTPSARPRPTAAAVRPGTITESRFRFTMSLESSWKLVRIFGDAALARLVVIF